MSLITALAISIGVLGGVATYISLADHFGLGLQIWAIFIAWGCFFHNGGGTKGLLDTVFGNVIGGVMAAVALIALDMSGLAGMLGVPVAAGICVGGAVAIMILLANIPLFSSIPAMVYGFAATAALALLTSRIGADSMMATSLDNPLAIIAMSMVVGAIFGFVSEKIAGALNG